MEAGRRQRKKNFIAHGTVSSMSFGIFASIFLAPKLHGFSVNGPKLMPVHVVCVTGDSEDPEFTEPEFL